MSDEKIILTPEEAESLLVEGEQQHNFANPNGGVFIGVDCSRDSAVKMIRAAHALEIAGPICQAMNHALVVWTSESRHLFFETDPVKVEAMEARKAVPA